MKLTDLKYYKKIKSFSLLIIPDGVGIESKSRKFTIGKVISIIGLYSIIVAIVGFLFFSITPLGDFVAGREKFNEEEKQKIELINKRMLLLAREFESLKSINKRLKFAILMGDSTLLDSLTRQEKDSIKNSTSPYGGNVFEVFNKLFANTKFNEQILFVKPVNGFISRKFEPEQGHMGIDFVVKTGTPVYASASGYIVFADYTVKDGYTVIIFHKDNYVTFYKHLSSIIKKARERVNEGELIALSGSSGESSTGPHLHFEIWKDGNPIDPSSALNNNY